MNPDLIVFGHRGWGGSGLGGDSRIPENSLAAFDIAAHHNVAVELDVWLTKDNEVVVVHGATAKSEEGCLLDTMCVPESKEFVSINNLEHRQVNEWVLRNPWRINKKEIHGDINYQELSDIDKIKTKDIWHSKKIKHKNNYKLPLLKHVLETYKNTLLLNVELKGKKPELAVEVLKLIPGYENMIVMISSFSWGGLESEDCLLPLVDNKLNLPIGLLFDKNPPKVEEILKYAEIYKPQWINLKHDFWKYHCSVDDRHIYMCEYVKSLHEHNLKVLIWWSAIGKDKHEDIKLSILSNVNGICVNDVQLALDIIDMC